MVSAIAWGYMRIMGGTILGGVLGFYVMHRLEISYKVSFPLLPPLYVSSRSCMYILSNSFSYLQAKWDERLKKYEEELKKKKSETDSEFA